MREWGRKEGGRMKVGKKKGEKKEGGKKEGREEGRGGGREGEIRTGVALSCTRSLITVGDAAGPSSFDGGGRSWLLGHWAALFVEAVGGCRWRWVRRGGRSWSFAFVAGCWLLWAWMFVGGWWSLCTFACVGGWWSLWLVVSRWWLLWLVAS